MGKLVEGPVQLHYLAGIGVSLKLAGVLLLPIIRRPQPKTRQTENLHYGRRLEGFIFHAVYEEFNKSFSGFKPDLHKKMPIPVR